MLIGGNAYAQTQLPKCVLFGFGNCIGTLRFSNGDIYTGEFNYGKPSGKGAFAYGNGDSYSGTVVEGQRHGSGTYTSAAGDKYVGQFSEGKFEGVGTYYFLANNRSRGDTYVGEFSSNTFNGQGRYTHSNGQIFVGSFVNGRKLFADAAVAPKSEAPVMVAAGPKQTSIETPVIVAAPKVVATSVSVADQVTVQVSVPVPKVDPPPTSVEKTQQLYGSKDSAVQAPQAAESRTGELVTALNERSKWYVTGGAIYSNLPTIVTCTVACTKTMNPWGLSVGAGYDFPYGMALEAKLASVGSESINFSTSSYSGELRADWYTLTVEAILSYGITQKTELNIGGGYYKSLLDERLSSTISSSSSKTYESENYFFTLGGLYKLSPSTSLRLKWSGYQTKQYSIGETDKYQGLDLGIKYNF